MDLLVTYDVVADRLRTKFFKRLKSLLQPVQKSVFQGRAGPTEVARVEELVHGILDLETDSVRLYLLCPACVARVRHLGTATPPRDPDEPVIW